MKVTNWFPLGVVPVRDGVYQRMIGERKWFAKYCGGVWYIPRATPAQANRAHTPSMFQSEHRRHITKVLWRGIAK